MTENARAVALTNAVNYCENSGVDVISTAELFLAFLESGKAPAVPLVQKHSTPQQPTDATKPAVDVKAPKKDVVAKAARKTEEQLTAEALARVAETDAKVLPDSDITREMIAKDVESMLKANLREECVALMKEHGGKSVSSLPAANYEAFHEAAQTALLAG